MNRFQWNASQDSRAMLRFATPRIPRQHLAIVLAEPAKRAWERWNKLYPDDWRPAWCVATMVAWAFGEATLDEVRAAASASRAARTEIREAFREKHGYYPWAYWYGRRAPAALAEAAEAAAEAAAAAEWRRVWEREFNLQLARAAERIRALMPYPEVASSVWESLGRNQQRAGEALLRLDGWQLVDAFALADFGTMPRPRLVAWDMAGAGFSTVEISRAQEDLEKAEKKRAELLRETPRGSRSRARRKSA